MGNPPHNAETPQLRTRRHRIVMILTVNDATRVDTPQDAERGFWTSTPHTISQTFDDFTDAAEFAASPFE